MPDRSQCDDRRDSSGGRACRGPRSGTDDGRGYGGAPRPTDGRQAESQTRYYDSQAFQHQSRPEAMGVRNSGARRDESPRRHAVAWEWRHRDEPQRRYDEPSRHHGEPQQRYDEPSRPRDDPWHSEQRNGTLSEPASLTQKRRHPDSAASAAPTRRVGTSSSPALGRAPLAPKGAVDGRVLNGRISHAGSTHELLRLSSAHSASLNHIHAANLWNKLGKQGGASGPSYREDVRWLLRRTVELLNSCGARELSNLAHGLAKCRLVGLDFEAGALFVAVVEATVRVGFGSFKAQDLANTAWAFATAGHAAPALLDAIAAAAVRSGLRDFKPQELANTAWAFATAGHAAPALLDAIAAAAVRGGLRDFNPQNLASTAWAFATANHAAPALLEAIAAAAVRSGLRDFKPQALANTAWAFASAGHAALALLDAIAAAAVRSGLRDFKPQELANTAWAFATAGHATPALLDAIAAEAVRSGLRDFNPQNLANTAWAFASCRRPPRACPLRQPCICAAVCGAAQLCSRGPAPAAPVAAVAEGTRRRLAAAAA